MTHCRLTGFKQEWICPNNMTFEECVEAIKKASNKKRRIANKKPSKRKILGYTCPECHVEVKMDSTGGEGYCNLCGFDYDLGVLEPFFEPIRKELALPITESKKKNITVGKGTVTVYLQGEKEVKEEPK